ncbi:MAG: FAD-linked oxidase, partial [Deltaproteobacteria bacterium]|nr:FAD-linked oxidase [Deltaproteobacteria bacterium]
KRLINSIDDKDYFLNERKNRAEKYIENCIFNNLTADFNELLGFFDSYDDIVEKLTESLKDSRSKKIIIATHMHAGDGNVHVNIPVNSSDYEMMMDADETAGRVILKTTELGGVISGEHGIGLTKLKFIDKEILIKYAEYKKEADPENLFNPGKLVTDFKYSTVYTPSLKLLTKETLIFEAADLNKLTNSISDCVRCGKCKPKCNTQYANSNMHYSPRNKILGTSLITEAILYEAQTSRNLTLRNFNMLKEVANHCTMCHNCYSPCPVNIDFGEVTLSIRQMLYDRKGEKLKPLTKMTLYYLKKRGYYINKIFRVALLNFGYFAQRSARFGLKPFNPVLKKFTPVISHILDGKFPKKAGKPTFRDIFKLRKPDTFYAITNTQKEIKSTVMYFPGCGSERMFSDISFASLAVLYETGVRVVIPPDYMCCGYPLIANGQTSKAQARVYENSVIFHRMAETVSYMNIENVVITCGTCHEMLSSYRLENIFPDSKIIDVNEFLVKQGGLNTEGSGDSEPILYHEPCHSPLKGIEAKEVIELLLCKKSITIPNCCGEGGTLALSTPDISTSIRSRKLNNIIEITEDKNVTVLTTCPSCVQGLSKNDGKISVNGSSLITAVAKKHLGKNWKSDYIKKVKINRSIEHILL